MARKKKAISKKKRGRPRGVTETAKEAWSNLGKRELAINLLMVDAHKYAELIDDSTRSPEELCQELLYLAADNWPK